MPPGMDDALFYLIVDGYKNCLSVYCILTDVTLRHVLIIK